MLSSRDRCLGDVSQVSPLKAELSPYAALSADARAEVQRQIDTLAGTFVRDVAKGRGVFAATVKSGFGKGRVLNARDAFAVNMIDGIGTFTDAFYGLSTQARAARLDALRGPATKREARVPAARRRLEVLRKVT